MLTIHFGDMDGVVCNTSVYFNNTYSGEWFSDPFAQKMIASVVAAGAHSITDADGHIRS